VSTSRLKRALPPVDRALCELAAGLTHRQHEIQPADLDTLRALSLDDRAIHDAVQVVAYELHMALDVAMPFSRAEKRATVEDIEGLRTSVRSMHRTLAWEGMARASRRQDPPGDELSTD